MTALLLTVGLAFFLVGFHSLTKKAGKTSGERQRDLIKLIFYFNGLIVLCVTLLEVLEVLAPGEILPATVFVVLCFNAFSYAYFHVFNMSKIIPANLGLCPSSIVVSVIRITSILSSSRRVDRSIPQRPGTNLRNRTSGGLVARTIN